MKSNDTRKTAIANEIEKVARSITADPKIGIYRLTMKTGSDNFRQSAILTVITLLKEKGLNITIYEPAYPGDELLGTPVSHNLKAFKQDADLIVANRLDQYLSDVLGKVFTRDLFARD